MLETSIPQRRQTNPSPQSETQSDGGEGLSPSRPYKCSMCEIMPIVETRSIHKIYPNGVHANDDIDFAVEQGEIHALVGENGAGKSTLMKMIYGLEHATSGQIFIRDQEVQIGNPQDAIEQGIGMVHQNFMLVDSFTVAQNIILNRETKQGMQIDFQQAIADTEALSKEYGWRSIPMPRSKTSRWACASGSRFSRRFIAAPRSSSSMSRPPS